MKSINRRDLKAFRKGRKVCKFDEYEVNVRKQ